MLSANQQSRLIFTTLRVMAFSATILFVFAAQSSHAESKFKPTSFPDSVALCLHVEGLQQRFDEVVASGLKERLEEFPPFRVWRRSKDFYKIQQLTLAVQALTGEPAWKVANQLFGESVFVGLIPKNTDHTEFLLIATRAESTELLQNYLKLWNDAEQAQLTSHVYKGQKYLERRASGETVFYTSDGRDIVFASHKLAIEGVLSAKSSKQNLALTDWYREADEKFDPQTSVRVFINPRAFDSEIDWADDVYEIFPELKTVWETTFAVTVGLRLNEGVVFDLHLRRHPDGKHDDVTPPLQDVFASAPPESLVALDGVADFAWFGKRFLSTLQKKSEREAKEFRGVVRGLLLGNDLFDNVLPDFTGEWALWVVPDATENAKPVPIDAVMQMSFRLTRVESNEVTDVNALANLGQFLVNLMTVGANVGFKQQATTTVIRKGSGKTMAFSDGIRGWSPGFSIDQAALFLFTNPRHVMKTAAQSSGESLATSKYVQEKRESYFPSAQACGWIHLSAVDQFIDLARKPIMAAVISAIDDEAIRDQKKIAVTKKIDRFQQVIRLGDVMFVSASDLETDPHFNLGLLLKKP